MRAMGHVLHPPAPMAVRLGYDAPLLAAIAGRLARAVMQDMRRGVKQQHGLASVAALHAGVVTVVQRFRSDLGLYVHLHCLATAGAYEEHNDGKLRFLPAPPPTPERMTAVLAQVHEVIRAADDDLDIDPALAAPPPPPQLALDFDPAESSPTSSPRPRRIGWAKLLARVFALDITRCRKCGGRMRVLEVVSDPDAIARILHGARAPPAPPPPGQLLLLP